MIDFFFFFFISFFFFKGIFTTVDRLELDESVVLVLRKESSSSSLVVGVEDIFFDRFWMDDEICGFFVSVFCVCLLFASYYRHSYVDGKGKWAFEVSKQASKQAGVAGVGITYWLDRGREDEVCIHPR